MTKLISNEAEQRVQQQNLKEEIEAEELARKNFHFLQIEKRTLRDLRRLSGASTPAVNVLLLLAERMNRSNAIVCSYRVLAEITGYSRPTLHNAIKLLEAERWIQVIKIGSANAYLVNSRAFWQDTGTKKRHASFNASIVASETEQAAQFVENWEGVEMRQFPVLNREEQEQLVVKNDELPPPDQAELL